MELPAEYFTTCSRSQHSDVVVCKRCKGEGKVKVETDDPRYNGPWVKQCPVCRGAGRRRRTVTVEYEPFEG
jgi:DnaJ-class molecular chaperone